MNTCLLVVDLQIDYFPGGAMELDAIDQAAAKAGSLLERFRADGLRVIHIQHIAARPEAGFFLPGTSGAQIHPLVAPRDGEQVIVKHFPNSFRDTQLLQTLRESGIRNLVICGAMSHMCIDATTRAAFDLGFACTVAVDACATRDLNFNGTVIPAAQVHGAFMAALSVPYARVTAADQIVTSA